jgi:hypothetical protein
MEVLVAQAGAGGARAHLAERHRGDLVLADRGQRVAELDLQRQAHEAADGSLLGTALGAVGEQDEQRQAVARRGEAAPRDDAVERLGCGQGLEAMGEVFEQAQVFGLGGEAGRGLVGRGQGGVGRGGVAAALEQGLGAVEQLVAAGEQRQLGHARAGVGRQRGDRRRVESAQPGGDVRGRDARGAQRHALRLDLVERALEGGVGARQARLRQADALRDAGDVEVDLGVGEQPVEQLGAALQPAPVGRQAATGVEDAELGAGGDRLLEVPGEVVELGEQVAERLCGDAAHRLQAGELGGEEAELGVPPPRRSGAAWRSPPPRCGRGRRARSGRPRRSRAGRCRAGASTPSRA